LRRDRKPTHRAGNADSVVDGGCDRRTDRGDAAFAGALDAERVQRRGIVLAQQHFRLGCLVHGRKQIIGEGDGEWIAVLAVSELLEQCAAEALREAADDLAAHQRRIDGAPDIVGDAIAFDRDAAGLAIDAHDGDVTSIRVDLVLGLKPALGG